MPRFAELLRGKPLRHLVVLGCGRLQDDERHPSESFWKPEYSGEGV